MKYNNNISFKFLKKEDLYSPDYIELQNKIHGENGYNSRIKRIEHYLKSEDFKIIVALLNGKMIGQAAAYKVTAIINGKEQPFYWGCDTFLLPESRGLGIGKHLQNELHKACPNFSSAWYSPINGIIKKKCGSSELMKLRFTYYPVSSFIDIFVQLITAKIFKKRIKLKYSIPYLYYNFNKIFYKNKLNNFEIKEIYLNDITSEISDFIEKSLNKYDFHIKRSLEFMKWAYEWKENHYHILTINNKKKEIEALVIFSDIHNATHVIARFNGVSILDLIINTKSNLKKKDIIMLVISYYKKRKEKLDGIITFEQIRYFPKFIYPSPYSPLLSTCTEKITNGYISFIDQDMDQL